MPQKEVAINENEMIVGRFIEEQRAATYGSGRP